MRLEKHGIGILKENELTYFAHFQGIVDSVDELATAEVNRGPSSYIFRITPSLPRYSQTLLHSLLEFHTLLNLRLELGKSIKSSSTIHFVIHL